MLGPFVYSRSIFDHVLPALSRVFPKLPADVLEITWGKLDVKDKTRFIKAMTKRRGFMVTAFRQGSRVEYALNPAAHGFGECKEKSLIYLCCDLIWDFQNDFVMDDYDGLFKMYALLLFRYEQLQLIESHTSYSKDYILRLLIRCL